VLNPKWAAVVPGMTSFLPSRNVVAAQNAVAETLRGDSAIPTGRDSYRFNNEGTRLK
jgi:hypothetical protein